MKNQWWGYLHQNGTVQVKRYFDKRDLDEADESPFVIRRVGPFDADTRTEAEIKVLDALKGIKQEPESTLKFCCECGVEEKSKVMVWDEITMSDAPICNICLEKRIKEAEAATKKDDALPHLNGIKKLIVALFIALTLCGCAELAVSPKTIRQGMTTEQLIEKVGQPHEVRNGANGAEVWLYRNYPMDIYYIIKDGWVIDKKGAPHGPAF